MEALEHHLDLATFGDSDELDLSSRDEIGNMTLFITVCTPTPE